MKMGKPIHRTELINEDDFSIISMYQSEYRGYVQYYNLAHNIHWLGKLRWAMWLSLLKTLARKHKTSVAEMRDRYEKTVMLPQGPRKCLEIIVEREGKKPLSGPIWRNTAQTQSQGNHPRFDQHPQSASEKRTVTTTARPNNANSARPQARSRVHHIRALKDLKVKGRKEKPLWMKVMSARRRKTLMVCQQCHTAIHAGRPVQKRNTK